MSYAGPRITIILPTFNRPEFVGQCLDSLLGQTLPPHQVIVVDDACSSEMPESLRPYRASIEYHRTEQLGKSAAVNYGLTRVTGEYVWIFDDDDVAVPDALERCVEPLEQQPQHGFSHGRYWWTSSGPDHRIGQVIQTSKIPDLTTRGFLIPLLETNFVGGAAILARTECYQAVGPFDTRLYRSQDYEMAIRLARRFSGVLVRGGPLLHYRQHDGMRGSSHDQFHGSQRFAKWLAYDRVFFAELYRELPLTDYLPPGLSLDRNRRHALLQRMAVMAPRLLVAEVIADLQEIDRLSDDSPFSEIERFIIQKRLTPMPYYQAGTILKDRRFSRALQSPSPVIRQLKQEIDRIKFARWKLGVRTLAGKIADRLLGRQPAPSASEPSSESIEPAHDGYCGVRGEGGAGEHDR